MSTTQTMNELIISHSEITRKIISCEGEVSEDVEKELAIFADNFKDKVDSYALLEDRIDAEVAYFKGLEDEFKSKKIALQNAKKRMREMVKIALQEVGKAEGNMFRYQLSNLRDSWTCLDIDLVPSQYKKEVKEIVLKKEAIEEDLAMGFEIQGIITKKNQSMRRYVNSGVDKPKKKVNKKAPKKVTKEIEVKNGDGQNSTTDN